MNIPSRCHSHLNLEIYVTTLCTLAYFLQRETHTSFLRAKFENQHHKFENQDHVIKKIYRTKSKSTTTITGAVKNLVRDLRQHLNHAFKGFTLTQQNSFKIKAAWSKLNPSYHHFGCFQSMVTWRY